MIKKLICLVWGHSWQTRITLPLSIETRCDRCNKKFDIQEGGDTA